MSASPVDTFIADVGSLLDGLATPEQRARIERALADDPALVDLYREIVQIDAVLNWRHRRRPLPIEIDKPTTSTPHVDAEPAPGEASGTSPYPIYRKGYEPKPSSIRPHHFAIAAVAATLLAACGLAAYLLTTSVDPEPTDPPNNPGPPVATLIQNTGDLRTPHGYPAEGDDFGRGEYSLSTGTAEFMLTNAVNVKLRGESRLYMRNNMNVSLVRGSGDFVVPPNAQGFTVHLPDRSKIVDLGTAFGVRIDRSERAFLTVDTGRVRIEPAADEYEPIELEAGQRASIHQRGVTVHPSPAVRFAGVADGVIEQFGFARWSPSAQEPRPEDDATGLVLFNVTEQGTDGNWNPPLRNLLARWPGFVEPNSFTAGPQVISSSYHGNLDIADPTLAADTSVRRLNLGTIGRVAGTDEIPEQVIVSFGVGDSVPAQGFRLGVVLDCAIDKRALPTTLAVRVGDIGVARVEPDPASAQGDGDIYRFDLEHVLPGDRIDVLVSGRGLAIIHGLVFQQLPSTEPPTDSRTQINPTVPDGTADQP